MRKKSRRWQVNFNLPCLYPKKCNPRLAGDSQHSPQCICFIDERSKTPPNIDILQNDRIE
jgi:hypothetical protein